MSTILSNRVQKIKPSATLAVSEKAKQLKAQGVQIVSMGSGEPDFDTPVNIQKAATRAIGSGETRYTSVDGTPQLKKAICEKFKRENDLHYSINEVMVSSGGKQVFYNLCQAILSKGDEVIIPSPYWVSYPDMTILADATPVFIDAGLEQEFKITAEQLESNINTNTKLLVLNSPSNPTGAVYPKEEIEAIGKWAADNNVWVITDEIYEHLVYGENEHFSLPTLVPEIQDRCIVLNGVAKTYAMTGWRVGWIIAPPDVAEASSTLQSHQTSNVANISQRAALAAVSGPLDDIKKMREAFDRRRQVMFKMLSQIQGVSILEPQGAFYAFPNFEGVLGKSFRGQTPETTLDLAKILLEEVHVALVPGEAFGSPGYARISFALGDEELEEGIQRVADLLQS